MQPLITRIGQRSRTDRGFTLVELLVVVVILGVILAIAIPLYLNYRKGANDASAQSDLRHAINVLEQCNSENTRYPMATFNLTGSGPAGTCTGQKINLSSGTALQYTVGTVAGTSFVLVTTNSNGQGKYFCYNSTVGGAVKIITPPAALSAGTC